MGWGDCMAYLKHLLLFTGVEVVLRGGVDLFEEGEGFSTGLVGEVQVEEAEGLAGMEEPVNLSRVLLCYEAVVDGFEGSNIDLLVGGCGLLGDGGAVRHGGRTAWCSSKEMS